MKTIQISIRKSPGQWYLLIGLTALELLMSFSFLGYFHIEPISITVAFIPVLLAGCLLSPADSTFLGLVFGLASMWKASAPYVAEGDQIFSPTLSGAPFYSLLLSVGSRMLFGLVIGLLYMFAKRAKKYVPLWIALVSLCGRALHSFFVYSFMEVLFPEMGYGVSNVFSDIGSYNSRITSLFAILIVLAAFRLQKASFVQQFNQRLQSAQQLHLKDRRYFFLLLVLICLTLISAGAIAVYFLQRMQYMLSSEGHILDAVTQYNLFHLQIQFLLGLLSLFFLVSLFLLLVYHHTIYIRYEAQSDPLTGVLNRSGFFPLCEETLKNIDFSNEVCGYFMVLDVDHFKAINDSLGHPKGDEVLCDTARYLQASFAEKSLVGRLGGDEFAVLIHEPLFEEKLVAELDRFLQQVQQIPYGDFKISCCIGVVPLTFPQSVQHLYQKADQYLYYAKSRGRGQYFIGRAAK